MLFCCLLSNRLFSTVKRYGWSHQGYWCTKSTPVGFEPYNGRKFTHSFGSLSLHNIDRFVYNCLEPTTQGKSNSNLSTNHMPCPWCYWAIYHRQLHGCHTKVLITEIKFSYSCSLCKIPQERDTQDVSCMRRQRSAWMKAFCLTCKILARAHP